MGFLRKILAAHKILCTIFEEYMDPLTLIKRAHITQVIKFALKVTKTRVLDIPW